MEVDIFVAQRTVARLLRGLQKTQLLRISRCFGHWRNWDQYERIKEKTDVMVATKQLEFFLSTSLQEVRDMVGCDRASFFMVNPETHELWTARADGYRDSFKLPRGSGIAGSTVENKTPSNVRDAYRDPRFNSSFDRLSGYKTTTILCYPVFEVEEDLPEDGGARNVLACVQLVNKHNGVFTHGDEDTCKELCKFLARAMAMEDSQTDFPSVRLEFDSWSIIQRKQLLMDRAYGNTIEVFLEQVCLLTGADGSKFILKLDTSSSLEVRGTSSLHEWHGTCQFSNKVTNNTVQQSVKRAWNKKAPFMLFEHIEGFAFVDDDGDAQKSIQERNDMPLDNVVIIPLFLDETGTVIKGGKHEEKAPKGLARLRAAAKRATLSSRRCVCILEFIRRLPSMDNQELFVQRTSETVSKLFGQFGKLLFDRSLSHESDGKAMMRLADIRSWVRTQMHKQAKEQYQKIEVASVHRKNESLNRTAETLKKQNEQLRKRLKRAERLLDVNQKDVERCKAEVQDMIGQRDLMAEQLISLTPSTPQVSANELEKQKRKFKRHIQEQQKENQRLKLAQAAATKVSDETSNALEEALTSIAILEEKRKADHIKLLDEKKRKKLSEEQLRSYLSHVCQKLEIDSFDSLSHVSIFTEDAKMVDVTDLRELLLQILNAVLVQTKTNNSNSNSAAASKSTQEDVKSLVSKFALKMMAAETQLAFLPKCQKMLTESKRTLATMQVREQARARQKEQAPLSMAIAKRHYIRKFLSTWRAWTHTLIRSRRKHNDVVLETVIFRSMQRNVQRRTFNNWFDFTEAAWSLRGKTKKATLYWKQDTVRRAFFIWSKNSTIAQVDRTQMYKADRHFYRSTLTRAYQTWHELVQSHQTYRRKENRAKRYATRKILRKCMVCIRVLTNHRLQARKLMRRIAAKQVRSQMNSALRLWERNVTESNNMQQQRVIFRHRVLGRRFRHWIQRIEGMRKEKRLLRRAMSRIKHRRLVFRLNIWNLYVTERRMQRKRVMRIFGNMDRQRCGRAWRKWVSCMETLEREKAQAKNIMKRWLQSSVVRSFNQWVQSTIVSRKFKQLTIRILTRWDRKQETNAVRQWSYFAILKRKQEAVAQRVLSRWLQESMNRSFNRWRTNATTHRVERQLVHRALARFTMRHVAACFHSWRNTVLDLEEARSLLCRILTRWDRKQETHAFRTWVHLTILKRKQDSVAKRVLARWLQESTNRSFNRWRTNATTHRVERQLVHRALSRFTQRHLSLCFYSWKETVIHLIEARTLLNRILTRWDRKQETNAFRQWSFYAAVRKKQDMIAQRVLKRWLEESLHRSFSKWFLRAQELKVERQLIRRVAVRLSNRKLSACFYGWRHTVSRLAVERRVARKALSRFVHQTLARCFVSWQTTTKNLDNARKKTFRILVRWDRKSEVRAFRMWSDHVRLSARQDTVIERILFRWKSGLLHRSFNRWYTESQTRRMDRQLARRALTKFTHRAISSAFHAWKIETKDLKCGRMLVIRILTRWDRKMEVQAFKKWVFHVRLAARQQAIAERIMWRWTHMTLVSVFHQWGENVNEKITNRNLEHRAMVKCHFNRKYQYFHGWRDATGICLKIRSLLVAAVVRHDNTMIATRFVFWKNKSILWTKQQDALYRYTVYKYGLRLKQLAVRRWMLADRMQLWGYEVKIQSCATFRFSRILRSCFRHWKQYKNQTQQKQHALHKKQHRLDILERKAIAQLKIRRLRAATRVWMKFAHLRISTKGHIQHLLINFVRRWKFRLQSRGWQIWKISAFGHQATQAYVAESILAVSIGHRRKITLLRRCMYVWSHAVELCVHRKRVAVHKCFKQWHFFVRRVMYDRHEKLIDRFHKAGLRGSQAEIQWALGKWQQFAFCIQIRQVAELERKVFLKRIRGENRRLRNMLVEYHRRGMFVLEGSKDYLVQRKIQPSLAVSDYETIDSMIASSYHGKIPAGVMLANPSVGGFGSSYHGKIPAVPTQPTYVLDLLTPSKTKPPTTRSPSPLLAAFKQEIEENKREKSI